MDRRVPTAHLCVVPAILAAIISGCATPLDSPTAPSISSDRLAGLDRSAGSESWSGGTGSRSKGEFYPLQLGNHWLYRKQLIIAVIPNEGEVPPPFELNSAIDRELICVERRPGRDYVVEETEEQGSYQTYRSWIRFRQDRTGLYEADVSILDPPPCVAPAVSTSGGRGGGTLADLAGRMDEIIPLTSPGRQAAFRAAAQRLREKLAIVDAALPRMTGASSQKPVVGNPGPGELTRLRYPLHPGARWIIRDEPGATFEASVEDTEMLDLPPGRLLGYRIQLTSELFGPADEVRVWYGRSGYLQLVVHIESDATDSSGEIYGRVVADERENLEGIWLSEPAFAWAPVGRGLLGR